MERDQIQRDGYAAQQPRRLAQIEVSSKESEQNRQRTSKISNQIKILPTLSYPPKS